MVAGLRMQVEGPIATITLDRPEKLNAVTPEMLEGLEAALGSIEADESVRVLVLTGAGDRAFCAGADINAWASLDPIDMWRKWVRSGHRVIDRLEGLRQPTIAALNGIAYGGGLELALACDLRIAADTVKVAAPEVGIGTIPGWGMTTRRGGGTRARQADDPDGRTRRRPACRGLGRPLGGGARGRAPGCRSPHGRPHRRPGTGRRAGRQTAD
jgi:enoyl-CoA hydratase/carnithine racemase